MTFSVCGLLNLAYEFVFVMSPKQVNDILNSIRLWLLYLLLSIFKSVFKMALGFCFGLILIKKINVAKLQNFQCTCKYIPF